MAESKIQAKAPAKTPAKTPTIAKPVSFWNTQPVTKKNEYVGIDGPIITNEQSQASTEPVKLVDGFYWDTLDPSNSRDCGELCRFLNVHYGKDPATKFRQYFDEAFIKWLFAHSDNLMLAIRISSSKILVGVLCGKKQMTQVNRHKLPMYEMNILCTHPKLRNSRMVPVLVQEFERRVRLLGYSQADFITGVDIGQPLVVCEKYSRILNVKKVINSGFVKLYGNLTIANLEKTYELLPQSANFVYDELSDEYVDEAYDIFNEYVGKYNYHPIYTIDEFKSVFMNNPVVKAFVLLDSNNTVIDFASYYVTIYKTKSDKTIRKANLFYYTCIKRTSYQMIKNLLNVASLDHVDVFDAIDIMENGVTLNELAFDKKPETANYYLFNWKVKPLKNMQVCKVIV